MLSDTLIHAEMIAPCGIDCAICGAHLRKVKPCAGCRGGDENKLPHCVTCRIRNCAQLGQNPAGFCIECATFPCVRMKRLDQRYKIQYHIHPIENLQLIVSDGMGVLLKLEQTRWECPQCGGVVCGHTAKCSQCGAKQA
jgi:hypothetical protein